MDLNIIIEDAVLEDLKEIQQLFFETINNVCQKDYSKDQIKIWTAAKDDHEKWISKILNHYFLVARISDTIVGFASLENNNYLDFLYVHKDYQRKGIAKKILTCLERKAAINRTEKITCAVSITAKPFFEKSGYIVIKEQKNEIDNVTLPNYLMEKRLDFIK